MLTFSIIQSFGQEINLKLENCLFGVTSIVQSSDKGKYVYSGQGITLNSAVAWSFDNNTTGNVVILQLITV